jgi:phage terminase small subunit
MDKRATERRARFVKEYMKDKNATRSAIAAGYSEKSAKVTGCRLLTDANVRSQIEKQSEKINEKLDISIERVRLELARLAFFDPIAFWNEDGTAKPLHEVDEDSRRAVAGLEVEEVFEGRGKDRALSGYIKRFKLSDKGANLERLGRHLQMFPKQEINPTFNVNFNTTDRLAELLDRAARRSAGETPEVSDAGRARGSRKPI